MPRINTIALENIRCFRATQEAHLGRITLLVGENSVGKSTFMGCYRAFTHLSNLVDLADDSPFDFSPFDMGNFDTIASSGKSSFAISGRYDNHIYTETRFSFARDKEGQPFEKRVELEFAGEDRSRRRVTVSAGNVGSGDEVHLCFHGPNFNFEMDWAEISFIPISTWLSRNVRQGFLPYNADRATFRKRRGSSTTSDEIIEFGKFVNFFRSEMPLPTKQSFLVTALDPRLPPRKRKYADPPSYLSESIDRSLVGDVGKTLNLWEDIELIDTSRDDATEVSVRTVAGSFNLLDVGYGVHSLLPLVHAIAVTDVPSIFLLQQPEVHVHPIAQARLAQYMAEGPHDFMIETHSDHLVDRFRLCVMDGVLSPEELVILYFENNQDQTETSIYNISIDAQGNVVNAPQKYREFFLTETERLLGLY